MDHVSKNLHFLELKSWAGTSLKCQTNNIKILVQVWQKEINIKQMSTFKQFNTCSMTTKTTSTTTNIYAITTTTPSNDNVYTSTTKINNAILIRVLR